MPGVTMFVMIEVVPCLVLFSVNHSKITLPNTGMSSGVTICVDALCALGAVQKSYHSPDGGGWGGSHGCEKGMRWGMG